MGKSIGGIRLNKGERKVASLTGETQSMLQSKRIQAVLARYNIGSSHLSTSNTDYGTSHYTSYYEGDNKIKIRFSDHAATNSVRVANEIMLDSSPHKLVNSVRNLEKQLYPNRFHISKKVIGYRKEQQQGMFKPYTNLAGKLITHVNKTGKVVSQNRPSFKRIPVYKITYRRKKK